MYILYLAIDANFKLKGKDRKITDIELTPGLGAFVNEAPYQGFINNYVDQPEVRGSSARRLMYLTFISRLIHVNRNTMPSWGPASGERQAMRLQVQAWLFARAMFSSAEMVLEISKKAKSKLCIYLGTDFFIKTTFL